MANSSNSAEPPKWPPRRIVLWFALAALALMLQGREWAAALRPNPGRFFDFSQEWLSARNSWTGRPVYSPQREALRWHTGMSPERAEDMLPWNAHPPVAVLLALPLGRMPYRDAQCIWSIVMLGLFIMSLILAFRLRGQPFHFGQLLQAIALLATCYPLLNQTSQGQLNGLLVWLTMAAWWSDRHERPFLAGVCIGAAAAVKLLPAFLFIYWIMQRQWNALLGGLGAFLLLNLAAWAVFGGEAIETYVRVVIPSVSHYQSSWGNLSLSGFWLRLFNPEEAERVIPWVRAPLLAQILVFASQIGVAILTAIRCRQAATREQRDQALGLCVIGMLLVAPIVWSHYLVMLLMPLAMGGLFWRSRGVRLTGLLCWFILWIPFARFLYFPMGPRAAEIWNTQRYLLPPAQPWQSLVGLSIQTYALVVLFVLYWRSSRAFSTLRAPR